MNIDDARVWFRYRSKMTVRVKANRSTEFRNNMGCRHCDTDKVESQAHLETWTGTHDMRKDLNLNIEKDHMVFWRRLSTKLRDLLKSEETEEMKNKLLQRKM